MGETTRYTLADVAARNGRNNTPLWVVYKDSVYDLTVYIQEHPGGDSPIIEEAGRDASSTFDDVGHTTDARMIMGKYKIGELVEEEKRYDANGKKKKRVVTAPPEKNNRSCINIITCGLLG